MQDFRFLTPDDVDDIIADITDAGDVAAAAQVTGSNAQAAASANTASIVALDTRVTALEAAPVWTTIADIQANMDDQIDMVVPADYDFLRLTCSYVMADTQPGSVLTAYLSADGTTFDTGHTYMNDLWRAWPGEPNQSQWDVQPWPGLPQTLNLGCRLAIDVGERQDVATHCDVSFTAMGSVSGNQVSPVYRSIGHVGFIAGNAGVSARPGFHGGGTWFSGDPVGTPFDWTGQFRFDGHWKSIGSRIRGIRLTMDGGGTYGRKIKAGRFVLEAK